jgi:hypothetical protein
VLTGLSFFAWTVSPDVLMDPTGFYCMALALGGTTYLTRLALRHQPAGVNGGTRSGAPLIAVPTTTSTWKEANRGRDRR